ncbi:Ribosomal silencing factor RsfS [Polaromonas vacuolata]|uniref:Ribosomal silencing factor RsfS n=1 Tax=Polaromonas vacuolata TaxID=37448 RepID=A0A6H2H9M0_9BURK|nr:ribosome silencing factor [Polaromonas vacuolata]QJC56555.1 Ribosomal silencing factor RsfS [Polaromonas vacuolata]
MTSTPKPTNTLEKKDVQKLQRAIIDGLEDVKAQDIQVFDTEHITSLFERVIIASGTSNRQTKALAASVRDAVRDAGFSKPRVEGEANGEWIIVDCGSAVAHIMQPTIRQYYHLEELWGEKPIKLKLGSAAPLVKASKPEVKAEPAPVVKVAAKKVAAKTAKGRAKPAAKVLVKAPVRDHEPGYIGRLGKTSDWTAKRNEAEVLEEPSKPARATRAPAKTAADKAPAVKKVAVKTVAAKAPAKKVAAKTTATKTAAKKPLVDKS